MLSLIRLFRLSFLIPFSRVLLDLYFMASKFLVLAALCLDLSLSPVTLYKRVRSNKWCAWQPYSRLVLFQAASPQYKLNKNSLLNTISVECLWQSLPCQLHNSVFKKTSLNKFMLHLENNLCRTWKTITPLLPYTFAWAVRDVHTWERPYSALKNHQISLSHGFNGHYIKP